jgi:short-chain fatty acids transporter
MQMALVLVTGHTLANAPIIQKGLKALSKPANTPAKAIVVVTIVDPISTDETQNSC